VREQIPRGSISRRVSIAPGATAQIVLDVTAAQYTGPWTLWLYQNDGTTQTLDWTITARGAESVVGTTIARTGPQGGQTMSASGPFILTVSLDAGAPAPVQASVWASLEPFQPHFPIEAFSMGILAGAAFQTVGPRGGFPSPNRHRCSIYALNNIDVRTPAGLQFSRP
jgi:hypothetical protein